MILFDSDVVTLSSSGGMMFSFPNRRDFMRIVSMK